MAKAAEGRPPAFQAGRRGSLGLLACELGSQLTELELLTQRKDPGLLIRESWVRIPPGPPGCGEHRSAGIAHPPPLHPHRPLVRRGSLSSQVKLETSAAYQLTNE